MKKQFIILALGAMFMASCADQFDRNFETVRPEKLEQYGYLNDYGPLKTYIDQSKYPNFKLGLALDAADYGNQGVYYVVANTNVKEVVAGNAMKMGSVVDDDGNMNFGVVSSFVNEAAKADMNVYGHTLAWHAQQPVKWLNKLIANKPIPVDPNAQTTIVEVEEAATCVKVVSDDMVDAAWDTQFWLYFPDHVIHTGDTYKVSMKVRADKAATAGTQTHKDPGAYIHWAAIGTVPFTTEWETYEASGTFDNAAQEGGYSIAFNLNDFAEANTYYFDDISLKINGVEVIKNNNCDDLTGNDNYRSKEMRGDIVPSTIVDKIIVKKEVSGGGVTEVRAKRRCIRVNSDDMVDAAWDTQFWLYFPDHVIHKGDTYEFSVDLLGDKAATAGSQTHKEPGAYIHWAGVGTLPFTEEWSTYKNSGTFDNDAQEGGYSIAFNLNDFAEANIYYLDNISLKINGTEVIKNGDCEGTDVSSFRTKEMRGATVESTIVDETVVHRQSSGSATYETEVKRNCIQVISDDLVDAAWDTQFWLYFPDHVIHTGDSYEVSMNVRADKKASAGTQTHKDPGGYIHWAGIGTINFEPEWTEYKASGTFDNAAQEGGYSIAFNLNDFASANTYYFDDISLKINGVEVIKNGDCEDLKGTDSYRSKEKRGNIEPSRIVDHYTEVRESTDGGIPQTPEEKKDTLTYAMDKWISAMMENCRDENGTLLVKAWDAVNEAISGGNADAEGVYALQHATAESVNDFFWQDYLGDLDYVRTVVALARKYGDKDIKLFINDYNLESDWDQNGKLKSLIKWIERWESDGVTKIDGIGSQMHISFYEDPAIQESKKKAITESFKLMAATGKLVRISELDMGYVKKGASEGTKTVNMTEEMHKQMAQFYNWIIREYMKVVPVAQQWGITQWCATDADPSSGWRGGEPVGLWDIDFYRKHTYGGFARGLEGTEFEPGK